MSSYFIEGGGAGGMGFFGARIMTPSKMGYLSAKEGVRGVFNRV
jgi:hypothetical protein